MSARLEDATRTGAEWEADAAALSGLRRRHGVRRFVVGCALAGAVVVVFLLCLSLDRAYVSVPDVVRTLLGNGSDYTDYLVLESRLPRAVTGLAVGACFGLSGAMFQTLVRNPLATPDIIGVTSGASAFAVVGVVAFRASGFTLAAVAVAGGVVAAALIYVLAWRGGLASYRLVLVGIALAALFASAVTWTFTFAPSRSAQQALIWITGSLNEVQADTAWRSVVSLVVLMPVALLLVHQLDVLTLGDDLARGLGQPVERVRLAVVAVAVLLASVATSAGGPIQFVAFLAGPIARRLTGEGRAGLVPSALVGSLIVLVGDLVGEQAFGADLRVPVGVVTGLAGAPYLILLLMARNRRGRVT